MACESDRPVCKLGAMRRIVIALAMAGLVPSTAARADEPQVAPKYEVGGSLNIWLPQGDADDVAGTSLGVRPQFTYWIRPWIGIAASFDWVFVDADADVGDVTYYSISAGARITMSRPARIRPYGELMLGRYTLEADGLDDSELGFRLGGGATYALGTSLGLNAGLGYSTVSMDTGFFDIDIDALILEVGVSGRF